MAVLKWHGGKHYLAERIIESMPSHLHYVEPFFGSGAVLFAKPYEGISEVVNDLNTGLTCFYVVLRNEEMFSKLQLRLELTPFSELEWNHAKETGSIVERAAQFFIRYRQSRQGIGKSFATLSRNRTRRGMNEQVSSWLSAVEGLQEAHERLRRVVVLNQHAQDVIASQDGPNTLFYLDPPYVAHTRTAPDVYEYEMSLQEHKELLKLLLCLQGKFILSGYMHPLYLEYATEGKWSCEEVVLPNAASSSIDKELRTECIWRNY